MTLSILVLVLGLAAVCTAQVYVDYGDPYSLGEFSVDSRIFSPVGPGLNPPPIHTKAYFPLSEGLFGVVYFVPGFAGTIPPEFYDNILEMLASHGYVVFSMWVVVGEDGVVTTPEEHLLHIEWLRDNTAGELGEAIGSFDHMGFSCHSAGCGTILRIMNNDTDIGLAAVNIEPVSFVIGATDIYHNLPTINFGAEWAYYCSIPGLDFEAFHTKAECPKVLFEAQNASHCDLLDDAGWNLCDATGFCYTSDDSRLDEYRTFVQGFTAAFFTGYIQGNLDQLNFVTDPELMPWELVQHQVDTDC